jgi:hypothetical protein
VATSLLALAGLVVHRQWDIPGRLAISVLIGFIISFGLTVWTANLGGQVRHTEARADFR